LHGRDVATTNVYCLWIFGIIGISLITIGTWLMMNKSNDEGKSAIGRWYEGIGTGGFVGFLMLDTIPIVKILAILFFLLLLLFGALGIAEGK
jgi:hypothetical protein